MPSPNTEYALERIKVLVLDDNMHMRYLIKEILLALGIRDTSLVSNVPQAFKELRHFNADIIITDWHLEPLDGFEFVKLVRTALDSRNPYVPIIMLSARTEVKFIQNARDVGVNEFLAKPVSAKSLYQRMLSLIDHPRKFLKTKNYVGPDRRRHDSGPSNGKPERRSIALESNSTAACAV
jgi:two-component system, chemotaxis family, chemotaxis protein CheY